jgi:hypothetical protein
MQFQPSDLRKREEEYRHSLKVDPGNCDVRLDLAWCLLLQSLYHAAQSEPEVEWRPLAERSLKEAFNVSMLSKEPEHVADVARIEFVVDLLGESASVEKATVRSNAMLAKLAADISGTARENCPSPQRQNKPSIVSPEHEKTGKG